MQGQSPVLRAPWGGGFQLGREAEAIIIVFTAFSETDPGVNQCTFNGALDGADCGPDYGSPPEPGPGLLLLLLPERVLFHLKALSCITFYDYQLCVKPGKCINYLVLRILQELVAN